MPTRLITSLFGKTFWVLPLFISGRTILGPLSAQAPSERHFLDSLLITLASAQPGLDLPPSTICAPQARPMKRLCEALLDVRMWKIPIAVPEARSYLFGGNERPVDQSGAPIRRRSALNARSQLSLVLFERPQWAAPYYVLAQIVLDDFEVDSALSLLRTAKGLPGLSPGIIELSIGRAEFARGNRSAGWQGLLRAASDTSVVSQNFMEQLLGHFLAHYLVSEWKAKGLSERAAWLKATPGVQLTLSDGLSFYPAFSVRTSSYAEVRGGGRFVAAFSLPTYDLLGDTTLQPGKTVFPVRTRIVARRESDGMELSFDSTRYFSTFLPPALRALPIDNRNGALCPPGIPCAIFGGVPKSTQWLAAFAEIPLPQGRWSVTLTLSQENNSRGVTLLLPVAEVAASESTRLTMTDLILGASGSTLNWPSPTVLVPLNPHGEWTRDIPVTLYFQLSGLLLGEYGVQLRFIPLDPKLAPVGTTTLKFTEHATGSGAAFFREAGIKQLQCGAYRVEVLVNQGAQQLSRSGVIKVRC